MALTYECVNLGTHTHTSHEYFIQLERNPMEIFSRIVSKSHRHGKQVCISEDLEVQLRQCELHLIKVS